MKNFGVFLISKNNYEFLDKYWAKNFPYQGYHVVNVDEGSSDEQREYGKKVCAKHGIIFLDRDKPGLHNNVELACKYLYETFDLHYLTWWQHDCWPINRQFMDDLDDLIDDGKLKDFGTFGFNGLATDVTENHGRDMKKIQDGHKPLGILGRGHLWGGRSWYVGSSGNTKIKPLPRHGGFRKPFAIESVAWFGIGLNILKFFEHIKVNDGYGFHLAWDDICYQFLKNNVYNVVLPDFYIEHRPDLKPTLGIPKNSAKYTRDKKNDFFFEQADQHKVWRDSWGWDWSNRKSFRGVADKYKGTLIRDFYDHDITAGPLKSFEEVVND